MNKTFIATAFASALVIGAPVSLAGDEELCLDCHEPAEDWEGMSAEEIMATAADTGIKRHADNADFTEEQLKAIVATLLGE